MVPGLSVDNEGEIAFTSPFKPEALQANPDTEIKIRISTHKQAH
jgi:hypothetical protein